MSKGNIFDLMRASDEIPKKGEFTDYVNMLSRTNTFQEQANHGYYANVYRWWIKHHDKVQSRIEKRVSYEQTLSSMDAVLYPLVKEVVCNPSMTALERNRATGFHRSVVSVLRKYAKLCDAKKFKADPHLPPSVNDVKVLTKKSMSFPELAIHSLKGSAEKLSTYASTGVKFSAEQKQALEAYVQVINDSMKGLK